MPAAHRPLFVTLEGTEGCGKSTQIRRLAAFLEDTSVPCTVTREPGGTAAGEAIRELLLAPRQPPLQPLSDLLLIAAARAEHLAQVIEPALAAGRTVLCDRYSDATAAYQSFAGGLPLDVVQAIHDLPGLRRRPDLTLVVDLPVEESLRRARGRQQVEADPLSRFEEQDLNFHSQVRTGYLELARREPERMLIVDGRGTKNQVFQRLRKPLAARLGLDAGDHG